MKEIKVINNGPRTRFRLGVGFPPNEEKIVRVSSREYLTIKAVKDFEILEENEIDQQENQNNDAQKQNEGDTEDDFSFEDMNVEESLKAVENGEISVDEAIAIETSNKNRSTLLEQLKDMKEEG